VHLHCRDIRDLRSQCANSSMPMKGAAAGGGDAGDSDHEDGAKVRCACTGSDVCGASMCVDVLQETVAMKMVAR
jgi:hypothetical protein